MISPDSPASGAMVMAAADPAFAQFRDQTRFWIQRVAVPLLMVIGVFGNLITVIIMTRRRMRSTTNMYLAALALVDMFYLVLTFLLGLSHYPNMAQPSYRLYWHLRPFLMMLTDACSNTSVWLTVTFTIERYIAVKYPMRGKVWCTEARARMLITSVFVFGILFAAPVPFEWKVIEKTSAILADKQTMNAANETNTVSNNNGLDYNAGQLGANADADADANAETKTGVGAQLNPSHISKSSKLPDYSASSKQTNYVIALDYSDFGRNETYKTIYYWSTAVIFYFIPLFSLSLFNGYLIKSVHQSKRERNKMTVGQQQTSTSVQAPQPPLLTGSARSSQNKASSGDNQTRPASWATRARALARPVADEKQESNSTSSYSASSNPRASAKVTTIIQAPEPNDQPQFGLESNPEHNESELATSSGSNQTLQQQQQPLSSSGLDQQPARAGMDSSTSPVVVGICELASGPGDCGQANGKASTPIRQADSHKTTGELVVDRERTRKSTAERSLIRFTFAEGDQQQLYRARHDSNQRESSPSARQPSNAAAGSSSSSQERRITIMLIAVVILFLLCQIPSALMLLYTSFREIETHTNEHAIVLALGNLFNFLMAVNAAGNFILYSFLSKKYRKTFVILFCYCLKPVAYKVGDQYKQKRNSKISRASGSSANHSYFRRSSEKSSSRLDTPV